MATRTNGLKIDAGTARAARQLLVRRDDLVSQQNDGSLPDNVGEAQLRGQLMGIDDALAALWQAALEGQADG